MSGAHLLGYDVRWIGEVDATALHRVRLAHLGRAVSERHHTRAFFDDESLTPTQEGVRLLAVGHGRHHRLNTRAYDRHTRAAFTGNGLRTERGAQRLKRAPGGP